MNLIITGAAGFIGSNFCCQFYKKFKKIIIIDCLNYSGNIRNIETILDDKKVIFIQKDILDVNFIDLYNDHNIDTIIHFAAQTHVDNSYNNLNSFISDNINVTCHILESIRNYNRKIKLIHFSTDEVYGPSYKDEIFTENSRFNPTNPYSASKVAAEMFINSYKISFNLDVIILRCNNAYGIKQHLEKVIPAFINKALNDEPLTIHGSGKQIRDFIHTSDISNAIMMLLEKGVSGEIYNISNANPLTIINLAKLIIKHIGKGEIKHIRDRPFNDYRYRVNSTKLQNLGWKIQTNFEDELLKIIEWHKDNPNYWN